MEQTVFSRQFAKQLAYLTAATIMFACVLSALLTHAATDNRAPEWSAPKVMALQRVSQTLGNQSEPVLLNNLDCAPLTYRLVASSAMQTGCFTETTFGLLDTDSGVVIFNGTDEGLPLQTYTSHQILVPWPKAFNLVALNPVDNGTLISLYKNPLTAMQDQRNFLGQLIAKRLDRPPDINLKDAAGKSLVINPQTIAFSGGGAWLVAETMTGSFVRVNLATLSMTAFAPAYGSLGSPALLKSRVSITENGRFVAIANDTATEFKIYDLETCDGTANNLQPRNCRAYDYWPYVRQQIGSLQAIRHVRFINDRLLSFSITANDPTKSGTYELAPDATITALTDYLGLGDSYVSGEGAFDYLNGTDMPNNLCHVARNSYPLLITHDLFGSSGGHSAACSGAVIKDVGSLSDSYRGQVKNVASLEQLRQSQPLLLETVEANFIPGYVAQQRFVQRWQPRIITLGIGGNDIGFGHIVQNCVMPHVTLKSKGNTCYGTYEDRAELIRLIDRTVPRWVSLYKQLKSQAPDSHLYAVGYPQVAVTNGTCGLNVHLDKDELLFAADIIDYLNDGIRKAASATGITYLDISLALAGHRLCETASYDVAVNGLTAGTDAGILTTGPVGKESYHPNAFGHALIAQAILTQTHNFTGDPPPIATSSSTSHLLSVPASGRPLNTIVPVDNLTAATGKRGSTITVRIDGTGSGLRAAASYTVRLDGTSGSVIGTVTSDDQAIINGSVTLPANTIPGEHTIDVTGANQTGESVDIRQPLYIPNSDTDADGDGIDTVVDSCPDAVNSNHDSDSDGIDDTCDGLIGQSAKLPPNTSSMSTSSPPGESHSISSSVRFVSSHKPSAHILRAMSFKPSATVFRKYNVTTKTRKFARKMPLFPLLILAGIVVLAIVAKKYIQKIKYRLQWLYMSRARKGFIYLLSLFLLATLLGTAISTSTNNTLGNPEKVEKALSESGIYNAFINYTSEQAMKSNGDTDKTDTVSLSDAAVKAAAESSFPPQLIEQSVNTFIDSNYAWLEGKTATPTFSINLAAQKQTFAQKVGAYVTTYTAGLPVCANDQLALQQSQDPLSATCRPASVTPEAAGAQVTQNLSSTGDFLSDPVITAATLNPEKNQQGQPYYEKLQQLPQAYQFSKAVPYVFAGLSLLAAIAIIFVSQPRRKGFRNVGIVLLIAGLSLVAVKFFADLAFRRAENRVFNDATVGQLQHSLTTFARHIESSLVKIDLWFGIGFILLAAILFIVLAATRDKNSSPSTSADKPEEPAEDSDSKAPIVLARKRLKPTGIAKGPKLGGPPPKPKKPTRLIQ